MSKIENQAVQLIEALLVARASTPSAPVSRDELMEELGIVDVSWFHQIKTRAQHLLNNPPKLAAAAAKAGVEIPEAMDATIVGTPQGRGGESAGYLYELAGNLAAGGARVYQDFRVAALHGRVKASLDIAEVIAANTTAPSDKSEIDEWVVMLSDLQHKVESHLAAHRGTKTRTRRAAAAS